jgi:GTPase SAR1 family protein
LNSDNNAILGELCNNFHGSVLTTTIEAWKSEIEIMKNIVTSLQDNKGQIIFEYDIPRLGKRIDVVLLCRGIIFCLEFKVGESKILEMDIDQVLDYALDLKNFHKYSQDKLIVPILIATKITNKSTNVQMSVYDDKVVNPLVSGEIGIVEVI